MTEEWAPIAGYENLYEVSTLGRVRSLRRGRLLTPCAGSARYFMVTLFLNGKRSIRTVHSLMAHAFVPGYFDGAVVRHLNGDRQDNRVDNIAWGTQSDNEQDKVAHGMHPQKSKTHCPHGHPYSAENTIYRRGARECRTCRDTRSRSRRAS